METNTAHPGYPTLTPCIIVAGAEALIDFLKKVFNAKEAHRQMRSDNTVMHVELQLGNSMMMISEATADYPALKGMFYVFFADGDSAYLQALASGAISIQSPKNQEYGHRTSGVKDQCGNQWWIASAINTIS